MRIGLVGKPNVGKSTFFAAATLAEAEIGDYPFTTIEANLGVGALRVPDPGPEFDVVSTPRSGQVIDGVRFVPVQLIDVAGLVPDAHAGRGLGNRFLNDLARADALIHVVDASGGTDAEGVPGKLGQHDPREDVAFLEREIDAWILGILSDGWEKVARRVQQESHKIEVAIAERLGGIKVDEPMATQALRSAGLAGKPPADWPDDGIQRLAVAIRQASKPIVLAWNKADQTPPERLADLLTGGAAVAAQAELALRKAAQQGLLDYRPGDATFTITGDVSDAQRQGLDYIQVTLSRLGSTGIHAAIEAAVTQLDLIPVYPVEDESKLTDKEGRVLPDCHLVPRGTTAKQLAYRVHTDLGDKFVRGIDCRTKRAIGADHELAAGDVIKIAANA